MPIHYTVSLCDWWPPEDELFIRNLLFIYKCLVSNNTIIRNMLAVSSVIHNMSLCDLLSITVVSGLACDNK